MLERHSSGSMIKLTNGNVLMATGTRPQVFGTSLLGTEDHPFAEIYNPLTDTWTATGQLNTARRSSRATRLCDSSVFITGGFDGTDLDTPITNSAEIYNPELGTWTEVGPMLTERTQHTVTLLNDCTTLLTGGQSNAGASVNILSSSSLFIQAEPQEMPPEEESICIPVIATNGNTAMVCL